MEARGFPAHSPQCLVWASSRLPVIRDPRASLSRPGNRSSACLSGLLFISTNSINLLVLLYLHQKVQRYCIGWLAGILFLHKGDGLGAQRRPAPFRTCQLRPPPASVQLLLWDPLPAEGGVHTSHGLSCQRNTGTTVA